MVLDRHTNIAEEVTLKALSAVIGHMYITKRAFLTVLNTS